MAKKKQGRKDVVFRRIKGRVVPIKVRDGEVAMRRPSASNRRTASQRKKDLKVGSGFLATGLGGSAALGYIGGRFFKKGAEAAKEVERFTSSAQLAFSFDHGPPDPFGKRVGNVLLKGGAKRAKAMRKYMALSKGSLALAGSSLLFAGMAGEGVTKLLQSQRESEITSSEAIASGITGVVTSQAVTQGFKSGAGRKLIKKLLTKGRM